MHPNRTSNLLLLLLPLLALVLTGCSSVNWVSSGALNEERSVKPGINTEYLKAGINVSNWVERFEKEGREIYEKRHGIVEAVGLRPRMDVADIGAGTGLFTTMLATQAGPRGRTYAVDIVPDFLKLIEVRCAQAGLANVKTVLCTERSVELPANSIDRAFLCDVYHHFEFPKHSLASIHRALRQNGEVVVIDFKRVPGVSSDWVLNHVRAGQETVTAEFEAAGFQKMEALPLLKDNYVLRFRKVRASQRRR